MNTNYTRQAAKALANLDASIKERIRQGIRKLPAGDIKRLKGYTALYRLRIGDWRILYSIVGEEILIEDVLPRGDAYK